MFKVNNKRYQISHFVLVLVLLTLNRLSVYRDDVKIWSHCVSFLIFIFFIKRKIEKNLVISIRHNSHDTNT